MNVHRQFPSPLRMHGSVVAAALTLSCVGMQPLTAVAQEPNAPPQRSDSAGAAGDRLEEVIVMARRREESLQSVPTAITVLSQTALRENAIATINDLQHLVPSMTLVNSTSRNEQFVSIRGISGLATDGQAVISYLNEVPLASGPQGGTGGGGPGLFYDLENVQVLKGPQGTLFGRNSVGGAIVYTTRRPSREFEGYLEGAVGNYANRGLSGAVNVPISESLRARFAFSGTERDGFTHSLGTAAAPGGTDLDNRSFVAGRGTLRFEPNEVLRNDLIYSYTKSSDNGTANILAHVDPSNFANLAFAAQFPSYPDFSALLAQQQALGIRTQLPTGGPSLSYSRLEGLTNVLEIELSESLKFRNIASATKFESDYATDFDGTILPRTDVQPAISPFRVKIYTEEPQLQGQSLGGALTWTAGGYWEKRPQQPVQVTSTQAYSPFLGGLFQTRTERVGYLSTYARSHAFYAQGTYDLSSWIEGLNVTAGYRYSWDRTSELVRTMLSDGTCIFAPPQPADCTYAGSSKSSGPNWNFSVDYALGSGSLLYTSMRHGYHSGGVDVLAPSPTSKRSYEPETATDVEIGIKSDWAIGGVGVRTNIAVYRYDYDDIQTIQNVQDPDTGMVLTGFGNALAARAWGVEFEGTWSLTDNLEVTTSFDRLDFEYTDFGPGVDAGYLKREQMLNRPRFKYGVGARYRLPVGPRVGDMSVMARWSWQDETVITPYVGDVNPFEKQDPYGLLTLGADWNSIAGGPVDVRFFVTNALDKEYLSGGWLFSSFSGYDVVSYGEPRMYGVSLRYRFGAEAEK